MGPGSAFALTVLMAAVFLYVLYFVVRAGVADGIRRALPDAALRPPDQPPYADTGKGPGGAQV